MKTIGVENCKECPHGKGREKIEFAFCMKAEAGTGKTIPYKDFEEGIIPDWCPLESV